MRQLYGLGIRVFQIVIWLKSLFNAKAKSWIEGQRKNIKPIHSNPIWFHCASLGEYKQAKPLMNLIHKDGHDILVSFFSPSGFQNADSQFNCCYLLLDTKKNVSNFIDKINPSMAIFIRSEYWFNYMNLLHERSIPLVFMNCFLSEDHYFFKSYASWFRKHLEDVTFMYTINQNTSDLLSKFKILQNKCIGDTKVDQVVSNNPKQSDHRLSSVSRKIILAASLENGDKEIIEKILGSLKDKYLLIIVPHDYEEDTFKKYQKLSSKKIHVYSSWNDPNANVIYVDEFGKLASLFQYAWISYIGGGFDHGIHNILESCVEKKPMVFGPNHKKFPEAQQLIQIGSAIEINSPSKIKLAIEHFEDQLNYRQAETGCAQYIQSNKGATQNIYAHLKSIDLLK